MSSLFEMVGAAFLLVIILMTFLWLIYFLRRNPGIVDIGWGVSFIIVIWTYCLLGEGASLRRWVLTAMVTLWAGRLAYHLLHRFLTSTPDPRYIEISKGWGTEFIPFKFYLMFLFQGLLVMIISLPFIIACMDTTPQWSQWQTAGIIVWLIGLAGEAVADQQLKAFKENPENAGKVCTAGLWCCSRHPNYFFEWVIWIGFFLYSFGSPWGSLGIIAPVFVLLLLVKVSGIPLTEAQALRTKGEAYREYQRTTSSFFPWF